MRRVTRVALLLVTAFAFLAAADAALADWERLGEKTVERRGERDVEIRRLIPAGGETKEIDLPGGKRVIKKVVFVYKTRRAAKRRAVVALWGKH